MKELSTFDQDEETSKLSLTTSLSMDDFFPTVKAKEQGFYIYEGSNPNSDCGMAINMILAEPIWIGLEQLKELPWDLEPDYPSIETYSTVIYQNMYNSSHPFLHNATLNPATLQESPVPGPITHLPFMFMPEDGKPIGHLNATFFEVWRDKPTNGTFVEPEIEPKRHGPYKFLKIGWRQYDVNGTELTLYIAQYIMVHKSVFLTEAVPNSIAMYVRANYAYQNGMRPILEIQWGINETERVQEKKKSDISMWCKRYYMTTVINRNFDHENENPKLADHISNHLYNNSCAEYMIMSDEQIEKTNRDVHKIDVTHEWDNNQGGFFGNFFTFPFWKWFQQSKHSRRASHFGDYCWDQLHIVLNRRGLDTIGDYFHEGCADPTKPENRNASQKAQPQNNVMFAQTSLAELLQDSKLKEHTGGQQSLKALQ